MTIKDLLVYVDQTPAAGARLDAALALAERLDAHLTALSLIAEPFLRGAAGYHIPADVIREHLAHAEAETEAVLARARDAASGRGVTLETRREVGPLDRLPTLLARHARHADLTIAGQPNPDVGGVDDALLAEAAFMDSGRPALVLPHEGTATLPPRRALVAWDGSREAARAAGDALPLLRLADTVAILIVDGRDVSGHPGQQPGAEIATHLARHGITAELKQVQSGGASVSEAILAAAQAEPADLLVMGGYGHSRLREAMLGGVTRYVLEHMTLPVLLSH